MLKPQLNMKPSTNLTPTGHSLAPRKHDTTPRLMLSLPGRYAPHNQPNLPARLTDRPPLPPQPHLNQFPYCDIVERAFGDTMDPVIRSQAYVAGNIIDKSEIQFGEIYGLHVTGHGGIPVFRYLYQSAVPGCIKMVTEKETGPAQDFLLADIELVYRVNAILNLA